MPYSHQQQGGTGYMLGHDFHFPTLFGGSNHRKKLIPPQRTTGQRRVTPVLQSASRNGYVLYGILLYAVQYIILKTGTYFREESIFTLYVKSTCNE